MSGEGTRRAIAAERARIRAKVQPEVDAAWVAMEEQQARDAAESRAAVARHQQQERAREEARVRKSADEEAAWQRLLTDDAGRVSMESGQSESSRSSGSSKSKEGQMPKLNGKAAKAAKAAAPVAKAKSEKKATYCLMTGKPTTGARFSGLGTDAKYKSLLINTALGDPKAEVTIYDHETGQKSQQSAISILKALNWVPFLEKSRASRKARVEAKNASSSKVAAKKAAGKSETAS